MRAFFLSLLLAMPLSCWAADSRLSDLKDEWRACSADSDCVVIHVNGCPWDSIPVARRYAEEVRAWAQQENMRHNCLREAVSDELKRKIRALCEKKVCIFVSLLTQAP